MGVLSEEDKIKFLIENKEWSEEQENFFISNTLYLKNLQESLDKTNQQSIKKKITDTIQETSLKLNPEKQKRESLVGITLEKAARIKKIEFYLKNLIFKDEKFKLNLFDPENFDYLTQDEITILYFEYLNSTNHISEEILKKICLAPFFYNFFILTDAKKVFKIFEKNIFNLTFYQQKLLHYSRNAFFIHKNFPDIPKNIEDNYDALINFANKERSKNTKSTNTNEKHFDLEALKAKGKATLNKKEMLNI